MVGQVRCKPRQTESEDKEREGRGGEGRAATKVSVVFLRVKHSQCPSVDII
jgi:hypothetical protein